MKITKIIMAPRLSKYFKFEGPETKGLLEFIFKGQVLTFQSPYPPDTAATRLRQQITETPCLFFPVCEDSLIGKVKVENVKLQWIMKGIGVKNSLNPIFKGDFKSTPGGSELTGNYRLTKFAMLFLCAWFGGLAAASIIATLVIFTGYGMNTFNSAAGIFLLCFVGSAVLMGASGIGLVAFAKRVAQDSLLKMSEVIKKSIEER